MKKIKLFKNIPTLFNEEKRLYPELTRIKGIGTSLLSKIMLEENLDNFKISELSLEVRDRLESKFSSLLICKGLDSKILLDIDREKSIASNKGFRHLNHLKLRGQRTKSTGRTKKIKRVKK
jgi:ribosomal protein S13